VKYVDSLAVSAIEKQSLDDFERIIDETGTTICGQNPLKILLFMLMKNMLPHVESRLTCYYTSAHMNEARKEGNPIDIHRLIGNVPDSNSSPTVSYVGMIFTEQQLESLMHKNQLTGYEKKALLKTARETVENKFQPNDNKIPEHLLWPVASLALQKQAGLFVTINNNLGHLRGCIGRVVSSDPLYKTVGAMAYSAAFEDKRFMPISANELNNISFDITVLSQMRTTASLHEIKLGTHGIMLKKFDPTGKLIASAVFLPQVPLQFGWDLEKTLQELSKKAGLDPHGWKDGCELQIFEGFEFKENYNNDI
jgi:AmmeMemoRadiSam system protein A